MSGIPSGREIPFTGGEPGDKCPECGQTIRPDEQVRLCHSCRVRPHAELIDEMTDRLMEAADYHGTRMSILLALRRRMFEEVDGGGPS